MKKSIWQTLIVFTLLFNLNLLSSLKYIKIPVGKSILVDGIMKLHLPVRG